MLSILNQILFNSALPYLSNRPRTRFTLSSIQPPFYSILYNGSSSLYIGAATTIHRCTYVLRQSNQHLLLFNYAPLLVALALALVLLQPTPE